MQSVLENQENLNSELIALRDRVAELEVIAARHEDVERKLARLANFPEQNPNMVIEIDLSGHTTYLNPVAQDQFPDLWVKGHDHPILHDLSSIVSALRADRQGYFVREVDVADRIYEQKICCTAEDVLVRIYVHDITELKRAEDRLQQLAERMRWLTQRVVLAQEEERQRVSRELHDEAGQALTALKISLELIRADLPPEAAALRPNFDDVISLTDATHQQIRLLARGLRPPALDTVGLNLTLEGFCNDFARLTHLDIAYTGTETRPLPDTVNICFYRVLQEALTNVAAHAQAGRVWVELRCESDRTCLTIRDRGRGFDWQAQATSRPQAGIGLLGMRERLDLLGGWLDIDSVPGQGTCLTACLPLEVL